VTRGTTPESGAQEEAEVRRQPALAPSYKSKSIELGWMMTTADESKWLRGRGTRRGTSKRTHFCEDHSWLRRHHKGRGLKKRRRCEGPPSAPLHKPFWIGPKLAEGRGCWDALRQRFLRGAQTTVLLLSTSPGSANAKLASGNSGQSRYRGEGRIRLRRCRRIWDSRLTQGRGRKSLDRRGCCRRASPRHCPALSPVVGGEVTKAE